MSLTVITPTRGRPANFRRLVEAVADTTAGRVEVFGVVDDDDPELAAYLDGPAVGLVGPRLGLVGSTNRAAELILARPDAPRYLASMGDDHLPRTRHWDRKLIHAIESSGLPGWAYGNDGYMAERIPTSWVVSSSIVRALGWLMLPAARHLYVDNATKALGIATKRLAYLPGVVIEHLHPAAGKAGWDASYRESNSDARYKADRRAFLRWAKGGGLAADAKTVRGVVE